MSRSGLDCPSTERYVQQVSRFHRIPVVSETDTLKVVYTVITIGDFKMSDQW